MFGLYSTMATPNRQLVMAAPLVDGYTVHLPPKRSQVRAAPLVDGYTQALAPGLYRMHWGPYRLNIGRIEVVCVIKHANGQMLLVDIIPNGHGGYTVCGHILWHAGPDECLTDALRVLRDNDISQPGKVVRPNARY